MFCKNCGREVSDNLNFCTNCGCAINAQNSKQDSDVKPPVETEKKEKLPKPKISPARTFLSVICCVMIFVFSLSSLTVFTVRDSISEDKVENLLDNVDIEDLLESIDTDELVEDISNEELAKIYRRTDFEDYAEDIAVQYTDYLLGGRKPDGIEADDVVELLEENRFRIEQIIGSRLDDESINEIYNFVDEQGEENLGILSADVGTNNTFDAIRMSISIYVVIALIAIVALFVFLLFKTRYYRIDSLIWLSVPLILTSLLFGIFATIKPIVLSFIHGLEPIAVKIVETFMDNILGTVLLNSGIVLLTGILLIVIANVIKKIKKQAEPAPMSRA